MDIKIKEMPSLYVLEPGSAFASFYAYVQTRQVHENTRHFALHVWKCADAVSGELAERMLLGWLNPWFNSLSDNEQAKLKPDYDRLVNTLARAPDINKF